MMDENEDSPIWVTEFDEDAATKFCNQLFAASKKDKNKPIFVYINSGGGAVSGLLAMMSAMDSIPNTVVTVAMGFAMSAGALLLAHGNARFASPHARIMVHKVQAGAMGNLDDILNEAEMLTNLNDYVMKVLASDCKKSYAEIHKLLSGTKREVYLDPEQAKAFGLIDEVGMPIMEEEAETKSSFQIALLRPKSLTVSSKPEKKSKKVKS